ncbi:prolyl oligopeptidase family serine peptidase [Catenuloplanes atrovinosus]|uniref:Esterase n=1 Tax=Catenuloplanes atrovinosus TaxID=137266 RepID=A0AAE3YKM0_9ACTN|nr:prolyl oligopeptidase family serine peptidase [Catenuloplanes atrovinosus]MDR7275558.1 putative esterase [Catenuloplanes atrovinosus]
MAALSRRTVLTAGAGAAAGLALPGAVAASPGTAVRFRVDARTLDGGEQVTSLTLDTRRFGPIDPASLSPGTFRVHVTATSPLPNTAGLYDLDRTVTAVRLDRRGDVVIELAHGEGVPGGGTLGWVLDRGRNVLLDLDYTITQLAPFRRRHGRPVTITEFAQGRLADPEVDAFTYHRSRSGMKYRLFSPPARAGRRPLVVWLHGAGEGASLPDGYYDNETTLRANRGALGFVTPEAQKIFGGAYVVAPQSTSFWMEDGDRFAPLIREIIDEVARRHPVDRSRVHVVGASNGGYMSLKMTTVYRDLFASSVPICGVVQPIGGPTAPPLIPDAELAAITTPTWLVTSLDDPTVPPGPNTVHAAELIPGALTTLYDEVVWNGYHFNGHWSWIYVARNHPRIDGVSIWEWMARQRRR